MNVLVPGGCGYVGAMLVPWLLAAGHKVTVYDAMWFGRGHLPGDNGNLTVVKGDVRYQKLFRKACKGKDAVIYLAGLTKDAMCIAEPLLHDDVNRAAFPNVLQIAQDEGVKRFIFASSVAAYGSSDDDATEEEALEPTTLYGHAKDHCEAWLFASRAGSFAATAVRSASVCGYSPRMRFDTTVNMMTHDAMRRGVITVNGGKQKRSHIHIKDLCDFYQLLLDVSAERISGQSFNVVLENQSVMQSAQLVADVTGAKIEVHERTDNRSYTVDGSKAALVLGYAPKRTIESAVCDIQSRFDAGYWKDSATNPDYQNVVSGVL